MQRVVAGTKYCAEVCPAVANGSRLIVADSWAAQSPEIMAAKPDLVIASVPYQVDAVVEILKSGVRFLGLAPRTLQDIYNDIGAIAALMGAAEQGERAVAAMQAAAEEVRLLCRHDRITPRVFCEEWGKPIIASQPWVAELVECAGGQFVGEPGKTTSSGAISQAMPDVWLAACCGSGRQGAVREDCQAA